MLIVLMLGVSGVNFSLEKSFMEKRSPFECGFQSLSLGGVSFSMPFFIISLIFLLFDVEILLVCFYPLVHSFYFYFSLYI